MTADATLSIILNPLILTPIISAVAGLTGVFLGGWISARNEKRKRRADFVGRQLSEFYGPIVSLRAEIRARSELRVRIQSAAEREWRRLSDGATTPDAGQQLQQTHWPAFSAINEDDNKTFRDTLMPAIGKWSPLFGTRCGSQSQKRGSISISLLSL